MRVGAKLPNSGALPPAGDCGRRIGRGSGCARRGAVNDINRVVVLAEDEARLIAHVLAVFERVLRLGVLDHHQLELLVPDGVTAGFERPTSRWLRSSSRARASALM